jgi:hypothetical protein
MGITQQVESRELMKDFAQASQNSAHASTAGAGKGNDNMPTKLLPSHYVEEIVDWDASNDSSSGDSLEDAQKEGLRGGGKKKKKTTVFARDIWSPKNIPKMRRSNVITNIIARIQSGIDVKPSTIWKALENATAAGVNANRIRTFITIANNYFAANHLPLIATIIPPLIPASIPAAVPALTAAAPSAVMPALPLAAPMSATLLPALLPVTAVPATAQPASPAPATRATSSRAAKAAIPRKIRKKWDNSIEKWLDKDLAEDFGD